MTTYPAGIPARCNRCDKVFPLPKDRNGGGFNGNAARLQQMCLCPRCGQTDTHWIYASDLIATIVSFRESEMSRALQCASDEIAAKAAQ